MRPEELIRKKLLACKELEKKLTRYAGGPAIFFGEAPDDNQAGWSNRSTMPRISFDYDALADKERKSAGSLYVRIHCKNDMKGAIYPEDIVPLVVNALKDVIFASDNFGTFCCTWNRTESYTVKETRTGAPYNSNEVIGSDITFDILEYSTQWSTDPDPVLALNRYISNAVPEARVLHYHKIISGYAETTAKSPVIYVRNGGYILDRMTNSVCWMRGTLYIHLLCPDASVRMNIATALANKIALDGEIIMFDRSPMLIRAIEGNNSADYLTVGQLKLETMYGLLRTKAIERQINTAEITERGK